MSLLLCLQELPRCKTSGHPQFQRSDSEVERRQEYLNMLRKALSSEACSILPEMIVECLDNDPSKRPTAKDLIDTLGKIIMILPHLLKCGSCTAREWHMVYVYITSLHVFIQLDEHTSLLNIKINSQTSSMHPPPFMKCMWNKHSWQGYQHFTKCNCLFWLLYSRKYWRSLNLAVWLQVGHLKIMAEFKFGSGLWQGRGANYALCMCVYGRPPNVLK